MNLTWWTRRAVPSAGSPPAAPCLSPARPALCCRLGPAVSPALAPAVAPDWTPVDKQQRLNVTDDYNQTGVAMLFKDKWM